MIIDKSKFNFKTNKEYFAYLVKHKDELIALKKSITKFTDYDSFNELFVGKAVNKEGVAPADDLSSGVIKRTIIGNTYNWLDSHSDVHIKGIFTKSIQENKATIMHLHDHEYKLTAKVGTPTDIYEKEIDWTELGITKAGKTISLMMDSEIKKNYNELIYNEYLTKQINQHSVGMVYVKLFMCVNDPEFKDEFANWNTYFPVLGNPEKALEDGVFWAVTEAKLKEISCVIQGSNQLTPTREPKFTQEKAEPEQSTRKINYEFLAKNFTLKN